MEKLDITHYIYVVQTTASNPKSFRKDYLKKIEGRKIIGEVAVTSYSENEYGKYLKHYLNPTKDIGIAKCLYRVYNELGKNGVNPTDRIKEIKVYGVKSDKATHVDTDFHKFLMENNKIRFYLDDGTPTEIFENITFEEVEVFMAAWTSNDPDIFRVYSPKALRQYQSDIIDKSIEILSRRQEILLYLSTRAGKSLISLELARKLLAKKEKEFDSEWDNILIVTAYPKAESSFEDVGKRTKERFMGWTYTHFDSNTNLYRLPNRKNIIFLSTQMAVDEKGDIKPCVKAMLKKFKFYVVIKDEIHNTMDSERVLDLLTPSITYRKTINLSGTPFEDLLCGRFNADNTVVFDLLQFIEYCRQHPDEVPLPKMNLNVIHNMNELQNHLKSVIGEELFSKIDNFNYNTLFSNPTYAKPTMDWLFNDNRIVPTNEFWFDSNKSKHIIMFFDNNKNVRNAYNALDPDENGYVTLNGERYYAINAADKDLTENWVNKKTKEYPRTCILSCGKLTTGVTLPRLDTVMLFRNVQSAELFIQIIFRTMTVDENKDNVNVYCFNPGTVITAVKEFSAVRRMLPDFTDSREEVISKFLSCFNVRNLNLDNFEFTNYNIEDYFKDVSMISYQYSSEGTFSNLGFLKDCLDMDLEPLNLAKKKQVYNNPQDIQNTKGSDNSQIKKQEHEQKVALAKKFFEQKKEEYENATDPKLKETIKTEYESAKKALEDIQKENEKVAKELVLRKALLSHLNSTDKIIFTHLENVEKWEDVLEFCPETLINANAKTLWEKAIEANKVNIDDLISGLKQKVKENKLNELIDSFSATNDVDYTTPDNIIERMVKKFDDAKGKASIDPTAGCGKLLERIHNEKGIPKEYCFGIELDPINVEVCHKLGYKNVIQGDATNLKTWLGKDGLVNIIYKELSPIYNWPNLNDTKEKVHMINDILGKDLLVLANPPYSCGGDIMFDGCYSLFPNAKYSILMPINQYSKDGRARYVDLNSVEKAGKFEDATITENNSIVTLLDKPNPKYDDMPKKEGDNQAYVDLEFMTYVDNLKDYYSVNHWNDKPLFKDLGQPWLSNKKFFDWNDTFVYLCRTAKDGVHIEKDSTDRLWNESKTLIDIDDLQKPESGRYSLRVIKHYEKNPRKACDNMSTWMYYKGKNGLANLVIKGLNKTSGSIEASIPHINWEDISNHSLWQAGDYDGAVLDVMGLKWNDNHDGVVRK